MRPTDSGNSLVDVSREGERTKALRERLYYLKMTLKDIEIMMDLRLSVKTFAQKSSGALRPGFFDTNEFIADKLTSQRNDLVIAIYETEKELGK